MPGLNVSAGPIVRSTITCPSCGAASTETMPTESCQIAYQCGGCGTVLRPKPGHCCVFCSYGSVPCPPVQAQQSGTGGSQAKA